MIKFRKKLLSALVPLAAISTIAPTTAQQNDTFLEEIIVTARKKSESLQDIPLSVSAFTSVQIERRDFRGLGDIAQATSGLEYEDFATSGMSAAPVIRGMGQTFTTSRVQNTGVFMDGIYLQRQSMLNPGLTDVARIEVLKGPQNAQYGRNAFSGAINYITKKPTHEFSGDIGVTVGDGERRDIKGSVGGPIIADTLYGRLSVGQSEFDGHTDNDHPFANDGPSGSRSTNDLLGGWDDKAYALGLEWTPTESLSLGLQYNHTESVRESQGFYYVDGARYILDSNEIGGAPDFAFAGPTGTNCLDTTTESGRWPFPIVGNHAYCGEIPYDPPVLDDPRLEEAGFGDTRDKIVVDPRSNAMDSESDIFQFTLDWEMSESTSLSYQYGKIDHEAGGFGTIPGRSSLIGSIIGYAPVEELDVPPYLIQTGIPGFNGAFENVATFNANPVEALEAESHELRLNWSGESLAIRLGAYYSKNEDEDGGIFYFTPPCDNAETCGIAPDKQPNSLDGKYISVKPDPQDPTVNIGIDHPFSGASGLYGNNSFYEDKVSAVFGDVEWNITEALNLTVEARYTREEKSFEQVSATFGVPIPPGVATTDKKTFDFFTPRVTLDWAFANDSMVYLLYAEGVKTGGFNAVDPRLNPEQGTFDEEENTTYEIGTKNQFFEGKLTFNAALYYIDWKAVQGSEAANSPDAWSTDVVGNIGDAEVSGFEIDGAWIIANGFYADYALALTNPEYKDAIYQSSKAGEDSSWGCNDVECRSDGNVKGSQVERTSKNQASIGLNFDGDLGGEWAWAARVDFNYRSKMYATPLNLAHNGSRTVSNANLNFNNGNLDITLWGKNIFDEEYVANSFVLPSFNRYIVSLGAARTLGLTLQYGW
jgi:iron complex outermembrane receptor protein